MRVTEAEILAAMTPAGGWTRDTLESWGVTWPPQKGWKEKLIAASKAVWLDTCAPVLDTDFAREYWKNARGGDVLMDEQGFNSPMQLVAKAGPAVLIGVTCNKCVGPVYVRSRSDATARLRDLNNGRSLACEPCRKAEQERFTAPLRDQYRAKQARVNVLRAMPYREYLHTPEWKSRAERAKRAAGFRCQTCASTGQLHVHHRTYARRGEEWNKDLTVLCADCHELFHKNGKLADKGRAA